MPWHDHTRNAGTLGTSQHGSEVSRVRNPVADQEKWLGDAQEVIEHHGVEGLSERHHALVSLGLRLAVESGHRDDAHGDALTLRFELNGVERVGCVLVLSNKNLLYVASLRAQQLQHRVTSFDLVAANAVAFARRPPWRVRGLIRSVWTRRTF